MNENSDSMQFVWTDYFTFRASSRGFDLSKIEDIVRYSVERYYDHITGRRIAIGKHNRKLVMIAYESIHSSLTPITIHTITRQQIRYRIRIGRYTNE